MGADGLAHSAGDSWQSAHLNLAECSGPDQCGRVWAVTEPSRWSVWDEESRCDLGWTRQWYKGLGELVSVWELPGEQVGQLWEMFWAVLGEKVQGDKWHLLGQSFGTDSALGSYGQLSPTSSYKYLSLEVEFIIIFLGETLAKFREKDKERETVGLAVTTVCGGSLSFPVRVWPWEARRDGYSTEREGEGEGEGEGLGPRRAYA